MFFDEKIQLVWVDGSVQLLESFVQKCCMGDERVHPTTASDKMSAGMGFAPPEIENNWAQRIEEMEQMAQGLELPVVEPAFEDARSPKLDGYLQRVKTALDEKRNILKDLEAQQVLCQQGIEQFSHFEELDVDLSKALECEYISIRFGKLPKAGFETLLREHGDDPYVFFIRCSEDKDFYWGMYFAPREKRALVDGIFAGLYFERVRLPGAGGTPKEIVENLQHNVEILRSQILQAQDQLQQVWGAEKWRCAGIYASFCSLARVAELCKCAAVRGEHFFYAVWVEQTAMEAFVSRCESVGKLHIAMDMTLPRKKWKQLHQQ